MFKVLIADDEKIICDGLSDVADWASLDMEITGIASDGQEAIDFIHNDCPDICLVDVCMPFVDGLEVTEFFLSRNPNGIVIIISGHDEFRYAKNAISLGAFAYILKPVDEQELLDTLSKARQKLMENLEKNEMQNRTMEYLKKNISIIRRSFFERWISGELSTVDISNNIEFLQIDYPANPAFILIKIMNNAIQNAVDLPWEQGAELSQIETETAGLFQEYMPYYAVHTDESTLMYIYSSKSEEEDKLLESKIQETAEKAEIWVATGCKRFNSSSDLHMTYLEAMKDVSATSQLSPIIKYLKDYIEKNYGDCMLSLQHFADQHKTNSSYLSRLFKKELHQSFIDYLVAYRIGQSIKLFSNPDLKICNIANKVGYTTQHYYCESFKRVMGISPTEYRKLISEGKKTAIMS